MLGHAGGTYCLAFLIRLRIIIAMTDPDNIILQHLRQLRDNDGKTHADLADIKHHVLEMRQSLAQLAREDTHIYALLTEHTARLERLERRLDLSN